MEHHINISLVLNPLFNSSMCCQLLVLSLSPQHHLAIDSLFVFLFWLQQYHASKKWFYFFLFVFWHTSIPPSCRMQCYRHYLFVYIFFICFTLFKSITPSHKPDISNSFRMIFIKIVIKFNIIILREENKFGRKECGIKDFKSDC